MHIIEIIVAIFGIILICAAIVAIIYACIIEYRWKKSNCDKFVFKILDNLYNLSSNPNKRNNPTVTKRPLGIKEIEFMQQFIDEKDE